MAIRPIGSGSLSIGEIAAEFGGTVPHSLSEYYRGGGLVPLPAAANPNIPTSGQISISDFYGSRNATTVTYQLIGGGGAGGFGLEDGGGSGRAAGGAASSMTGPGINITSAGGLGGFNGNLPHGTSGAGQASAFGPGGPSTGNGSAGRPAPITSYGAGGGGGGGDQGDLYDNDGACGDGGLASQIQTGTLIIPYGTVLSITIGAGGVGSGGVYPGGAGANGVCTLTYDGTTYFITSTSNYTII